MFYININFSICRIFMSFYNYVMELSRPKLPTMADMREDGENLGSEEAITGVLSSTSNNDELPSDENDERTKIVTLQVAWAKI